MPYSRLAAGAGGGGGGAGKWKLLVRAGQPVPPGAGTGDATFRPQGRRGNFDHRLGCHAAFHQSHTQDSHGAADALCFDARTAGDDEPCAAQLKYMNTRTRTHSLSHTHTQTNKYTHMHTHKRTHTHTIFR